jgi:hypothetical protein
VGRRPLEKFAGHLPALERKRLMAAALAGVQLICPDVTVTLEKSFLLAWLEAHEHRQDPGENGRRIEHFIGENEHLS